MLSNADDAIRSRHATLVTEMVRANEWPLCVWRFLRFYFQIEKGKQKMRMRLARFLPFILPTLSLADTVGFSFRPTLVSSRLSLSLLSLKRFLLSQEVIFNGAMKNFMGVKALSASAPPASSLKMAAPVLPILPLAKLMYVMPSLFYYIPPLHLHNLSNSLAGVKTKQLNREYKI